jgi:hypothetical protein
VPENFTIRRGELQSRREANRPMHHDRLARPGRHWVWLSMVMYALACYLPAIPAPLGGPESIRGYVLLITLNDPIVKLYLLPAWWANPAYFAALILYACGRHRIATGLAVIAVALAVSFELMGIENPQTWYAELARMELGFHFWIISIQVLACNLLCEQWRIWRLRREQLDADPLNAS